MSININGSEDPFYRYKMEELFLTLGGNGNGVFTIINNIDSVSKSINTPSEILLKYLAYHLGSSYNDKKKSFTGHHDLETLNIGLFNYINSFVICISCSIPELFYSLDKKGKKSILQCKCSACGTIHKLNFNNKMNNKGIDIIEKYLEKNTWIVIKGNMVLESKYDEIFKSFNPFEV
jgi:translation initiation factor 2 beta subunit (eIF-2beta)/eIF-5